MSSKNYIYMQVKHQVLRVDILVPLPLVEEVHKQCVCVCVFIKLHRTAQSGLVILVILCHSR